MIIFVVGIISFVFVIYVCHCLKREKSASTGLNTIPFEKGLPILGVANKVGCSLCNYLLKLSRKHGPIYRMKYGMRNVVVLNSYEYIKTAFVDRGHAFSGRCKGLNYAIGSKDSGLLFIDGNVWAEQRSFVLKSLRDLGVGRSRSVEIIQAECEFLLKDLKSLEGKGINFYTFASPYTINIISTLVMNKRFIRGDPEFQIFEKYMTTVATQNDSVSNWFVMFPFIERNECLRKFLLWITSRNKLLDESHDMFRKRIKINAEKLDFHSDGDDLTDKFLINQHRLKQTSGNTKSFTTEQLVRNNLDLMGAGYDISATLVWSFLFMAMYPEIQNKVYEEIINKVGYDRLITAVDKMSLTYTQAVMDEILRFGTVEPLANFHRAIHDTDIKGYYIPKDTIVIPNILACHLDPFTWERPFEFHPEHFLVRDDKGELKYKPREELIPFSMGKRSCMGESLGRMGYFIFYVNIIRRFRVSLANRNANFDVLCATDSIIRAPEIVDFIFESRP